MVARVAGCTMIVVVDVRPPPLELAWDFGATHAMKANKEVQVEASKHPTGGVGADFSIDASGSSDVLPPGGPPHRARRRADCSAPGRSKAKSHST